VTPLRSWSRDHVTAFAALLTRSVSIALTFTRFLSLAPIPLSLPLGVPRTPTFSVSLSLSCILTDAGSIAARPQHRHPRQPAQPTQSPARPNPEQIRNPGPPAPPPSLPLCLVVSQSVCLPPSRSPYLSLPLLPLSLSRPAPLDPEYVPGLHSEQTAELDAPGGQETTSNAHLTLLAGI
jgi:hypothetical protein